VVVAVGVLALVGLLAYGLASNEPDRDIDAALARGERQTAPVFTAPRLSGDGEASLDDYRGKVVILNYWASWCDPCRQESPLLQRWHKRISPRGGTVLGVDVRDVSDDALEFISEYRLTYPHLRDGPGDTMDDYGVIGLPETFVIDRKGRIAATARGPVDEEFLQRNVPRLLREPA
jgi:cytochrome c biogenesis protein CcmG, thiol:disulfide interchange protein DsbE